VVTEKGARESQAEVRATNTSDKSESLCTLAAKISRGGMKSGRQENASAKSYGALTERVTLRVDKIEECCSPHRWE
jgi:hypothetical protein